MTQADDIKVLSTEQEVDIVTLDGDRAISTIIWTVAIHGTIYVRSFLGDEGAWYRRARANPAVALRHGETEVRFMAVLVDDTEVIDQVSQAYVAKYRPGRSRDAMVRPEVLHTTLRLDPHSNG